MLKKLMKYDLNWINKYMVIYFILSVVFAIICKITSNFTNVFIGLVIDKICSSVEIGCLVSMGVSCLMRCWVRFKRNIYKDESYLTHTLPVSRGTVYKSKVLSTIISIVLTLLVIAICVLIVDSTILQQIKDIFQNKEMTEIFLVICVIAFLEVIYLAICGIVGTIIGHKANNYKNLRSILVAIMIYWILQALLIANIVAIGAFNPEVKSLYVDDIETLQNLSGAKIIMYVSLGMYLVYNIGLYFFGKKMLEKGVNVD